MRRKYSTFNWIFWPSSAVKILLFVFYKLRIEDLWHLQTIAQNKLNGIGFNYLYAHAENISNTYTQPLVKWPPALSFLIAELSFITGNIDVSVLILDITGMLLTLMAIRKIINLLDMSVKLKTLIYLVIITNLTTVDLFSTTDIFSAAFFLWGCVGLFSLMAGKANFLRIFFVSILLFLPAAFRYQFYPLTFLPGAFLFVYGLINKQRRMVKDSLRISGLILLLLVIQIIALNSYSGQATYLNDKTGFFPGNLRWLDFFYLKAFVPVHLLFSFVQQIWTKDIGTLYLVVSGLNIFLLIGVIYLASVNKSLVRINNIFSAFVIWITLGWIVFLCSLSLFYKMQGNGSFGFTYVMGTRYWSVPIFLLPVMTVCGMHNFKKNTCRIFYFGLIAVIIFNSIVILNRVYKPIIRHDYSETYPGKMKDKEKIGKTIEDLIRAEKKPVVIACYDSDFGMYSSKRTYALVDNYEYFIDHKINEPINAYLLLVTSENETFQEKTFIKENNFHHLFDGKGFHLYRYY